MPVLTGLKSKYGVGEILEGNCISGGSRPAANLTWFLNGEKMTERHMASVTSSFLCHE
ncbi:hypothetical protein RUM44_011956 [Polyplax serrata]|uniref:Ig-like domain-containing protein n=1 Tax=Polyplax serrata TaxID=468196 RepID=A0ABR1BC47_POLSC